MSHRSTPAKLPEVSAEVRFVLGDRYYNTPDLHTSCEQADWLMVATEHCRYPHSDEGVEVRRVFHNQRERSLKILMSISKASLMDMDNAH